MPEQNETTLERGDRDLVSLAVLALLLTGPKHTYEMHRMIVRTRKDFVTGLPRSMYHAVDRLVRAGDVEAVGTVRDGRAPERTVIAVTAQGRRVLAQRLARLLGRPDADATLFTAALSFVSCLPPAHAAAALRTRCDALSARLGEIDADSVHVPVSLPRVLLLETEHERAALQAQLAWVRDVLRDLEAGALGWPDDVAELAASLEGEEVDRTS